MWVYAFSAWTEFVVSPTSPTGATFRIDYIVPAPRDAKEARARKELRA